MNHANRTHATLAPSAAHRWMNCPGSVRMSAGISEAPSVFANEGTAAHMLAEACMKGGFDAERFRWQTVYTNGAHVWQPISVGKPDGVISFPVNDEMIDGVQLYLDVVRDIKAQSDEFDIEQRLDVSDIIPGAFGTGDAIAYRERQHLIQELEAPARVTIADLKYGKGVAVEVEDNKQLLTYALGVAKRYHNRGVDEVELVIVQPRAPHPRGPVRRWVTDVGTLYEHAMAAQAAAVKADAPDAELHAGSWCRFCRAAGFCGELRDTVHEIIGAQLLNGEIVAMADPTKYNPDELAQALKNKELVAGWLKNVDSFSHFEATRGRVPPGFKLVAKKAHRKWVNEATARETLTLLGLDEADISETKMLSPAKVEKLLPRGERKLVNDLASSESSETVLASVEDPRPAIDPTDARGFEPMEME